jgi:hypothetical protein
MSECRNSWYKYVMVIGIMLMYLVPVSGDEQVTMEIQSREKKNPMNPESLLSTISELEPRLTSAEKRADAQVLEELVSDDFMGVNQMGQRIDKRAFIAGLCASGIRFDNLEIADLNIRLAEKTVIVIGRSIYKVVVGEQVIDGTAQFIDTWIVEGENWRLYATSIIPERTR